VIGFNQVWLWSEVAQLLATQPPRTVLRVQKHQVEHPNAAGLATSIGFPFGQRADFRFRYSDCTGLHVRDFGPYYEAYVDRANQDVDLTEQLLTDVRGSHFAAMAALGAFVGTLLGRKPGAVIAGAAVGGVLAMLTASAAIEDVGNRHFRKDDATT
jgi:hypothetical protein